MQSLSDPGFSDAPPDVGQSCDDSTPLSDLGLSLEYDMGSTTYVRLRCCSEVTVSVGSNHFEIPVRCTSTGEIASADQPAESISKYCPPPGQPTLDAMFPHLSSLVTDPRVGLVCLFPSHQELCAVIEAGPNAMADLLFAPMRFDSAEGMLYACDQACDPAKSLPIERSGVRWDAISRMVFPTCMPDSGTKNQSITCTLRLFMIH